MSRRSPLLIDLKEGFRFIAKRYLAVAFVAAASAASFTLTTSARGFTPNEVPSSFGNLTAYALAGMEAFLPSPSEPFRFPVSWAVTMLLLAYITLDYPYRDLLGFGQKVLVSCESRRSWWLSKCCWTTLCVCLFWCVFYGVTALASIALGASWGIEVSPTLEKVLRLKILIRFDEVDYALFLCSVPLITLALCLIQLCLSLFLSPTVSYLVTFSQLFLAAFYYKAPFLLGNYLMSLRTPGVSGSGFPLIWGALIAAFLSITATLVGEMHFSHMDILKKES